MRDELFSLYRPNSPLINDSFLLYLMQDGLMLLVLCLHMLFCLKLIVLNLDFYLPQ